MTSPTEAQHFGHRKILIVDDDPNISKVLEVALIGGGYNPTMVANTQRALEEVAAHEFEVILLDIGLPGMSGLEAIKLFKAEQPDVYIVMVTAQSDISSAVTAMRQGAFDYITKPFDIDEMLNTVKEARELRYLSMMTKSEEYDLRYIVAAQATEIRQIRTRQIHDLFQEPQPATARR